MNKEMLNYRFPAGKAGKKLVREMNRDHADLSDWVFSLMKTEPQMTVLDLGCGGGENLRRLITLCPQGFVYGMDHSPVAVKESRKLNRKAIEDLCCRVLCGKVDDLPFSEGMFDLITAFETIYFWPDLEKTLTGIARCLKPEGCFVIAQTTDGTKETDREHMEMIPGMKVYTMEELNPVLKQAGFRHVEFYTSEEKDLCLFCTK